VSRSFHNRSIILSAQHLSVFHITNSKWSLVSVLSTCK